MKKFKLWLFDTLCGIFLCVGLVTVLWLFAFLIFKFPDLNFTNIAFMAEFISLFWVTGFIFHFTSPVVTKGILHSIICFMLSVILFSINFGFVPAAQALIICMLAFFTVYALLLWGFTNLSKNLNAPLRHFSEWLFKLRPQIIPKISDDK